MLNELSKVTKIDEIVSTIIEKYISLAQNSYAPAIISEGSLIDPQISEDFYLKTVLTPKEFNIDDTWLIGNLIPQKIENSVQILNIVTWTNYKFNKLYTFNPLILNDDELVVLEQIDNTVLNQVYGSADYVNHPKLLKKNDDPLYDEFILFFFPAIKEFLKDNSIYSDGMSLFIDFEYRSKKYSYSDIISEKIIIDNAFLKTSIFDNTLVILGTIKIPVNRLIKKFDSELKSINPISVLDFPSGQIRSLNPSNYNDDTTAGLIVFDKKAYEVIKQFFYVFPLKLISKSNFSDEYIVDTQKDTVIFWEGQFNRLPKEIKEMLSDFNLKSFKTKGLLSAAMYNRQVRGVRDISNDFSPYEKLANYLFESFFNSTIENNLYFIVPNNFPELKHYIESVLNVLDLKLDDLNIPSLGIEKLEKILSENYELVESEDIYSIFQVFSDIVLEKIHE